MNIVLPRIEAGARPTIGPAAIKAPPGVASGCSLAHLLAGKSAIQKALIVAKQRSVPVRLTLRQWALIAGVSPTYIHAALKLDPDERRLVDVGLRPMITPPRRAVPVTPKNDVETMREIVGRVGIDRTLEMIVAVEVAAAA